MQPSFSLPNVYSDHMVFQRGKPIAIAGTAPARAKIQVSFDGVKQTVEADLRGDWRAEFPAQPAGIGHTVRVENGWMSLGWSVSISLEDGDLAK